DTALDAVITIDAQGTITGWTAQAEHTFGWYRSEVLGRRISETIIPHRYREAHENRLGRFLATGHGPILSRRIETVAHHRDGHEFPVELAITALKMQQGWGFSAFVRDLTESKRIEDALRDAQADLARVNRLTAMDALTTSIAHEINQPLAAI